MGRSYRRSLENWIRIHLAKCAGEGDAKTLCKIIKTRNNTLLRQLNGAKMGIKFFNIGGKKMGIEKSMYFLHLFIPLACAEYDNSLPFSGVSSISVHYIPFPFTLFQQLVFHPPSCHLAIYFLVFLSAVFPNSYIILFWESCFLPFSVCI
jgi:hypothetical protein